MVELRRGEGCDLGQLGGGDVEEWRRGEGGGGGAVLKREDPIMSVGACTNTEKVRDKSMDVLYRASVDY